METFTNEKLYQIAAGDSKVFTGIKGLLQETITFSVFNEALILLIDAKSDHYLQAAETRLQITINEIKKQAPNLGAQKTALYLYSLQKLMNSLGQWRFPNGKVSTYHPTLMQKLRHLTIKGNRLGITDTLIHQQCYNDQYKIHDDPILCNFELLDEQRMHAFENKLYKYAFTQNPSDLFTNQTVANATQQPQKANAIIDKIITILSNDHLETTDTSANTNFQEKIASILAIQDPLTVARLEQIIKQRLLTTSKSS